MIVIDLPFPPSANRIWRQVSGKRRVITSPAYREWIRHCDSLMLATGTLKRVKTITGGFECWILLDADTGYSGDLDNRCKVVLDYCQNREVITNDKHCRRLIMEWCQHTRAPSGCRAIFVSIP